MGLTLVVVLTSACVRKAPASVSDAPSSRFASDSARGTVALTGSCVGGFTMLSVAPDKGMILQGGSSNAPMWQLSGVEVVVFGARKYGPFPWPVQEVDSFFVRSSGGMPALDGTLRRERDRDLVELRDGRRIVIPHLPKRLEQANGMRVWIAGPIDGQVGAGVVAPALRRECAE